MASKKFYVVWVGGEPGIYDSWAECQGQIQGVQGARYKAFESRAAAEKAYREDWRQHIKAATTAPDKHTVSPNDRKSVGRPIADSLSVDAACSGNPGLMEYRGVYTADGTQLFARGPYPHGTNNIGEFLAIVHALALLKQKGRNDLPVYSDSATAIGWIRKKKANTKLERTAQTEELHELLERAENWLAQNTYANPLLKWETEHWGEIPADFGRK